MINSLGVCDIEQVPGVGGVSVPLDITKIVLSLEVALQKSWIYPCSTYVAHVYQVSYVHICATHLRLHQIICSICTLECRRL